LIPEKARFYCTTVIFIVFFKPDLFLKLLTTGL